MISLNVGCDIGDKVETLKHSWLKNLVLNLRAEEVGALYAKVSPGRVQFEHSLAKGGEFDICISEVYQLVQEVVEAFSPARLVEAGPLNQLPINVRDLIAQILHQEYLNQTNIESLAESIKKAIDMLATEFENLRTKWFHVSQMERGLIEIAYRNFQEKAENLQELLGSLPKGYMLP